MKLLRLSVLVLVCLFATRASAEDGFQVEVIGLGVSPCSSWLANDTDDRKWADWIGGYFTGSNENNADHKVGGNTKEIDIIAKVKAECRTNPTETVFAATAKTYYLLGGHS